MNLRGCSVLPQSPSFKALNLHYIGLGSSGYFCANLLMHKRKKAQNVEGAVPKGFFRGMYAKWLGKPANDFADKAAGPLRSPE